jgi:hypothetical protein
MDLQSVCACCGLSRRQLMAGGVAAAAAVGATAARAQSLETQQAMAQPLAIAEDVRLGQQE